MTLLIGLAVGIYIGYKAGYTIGYHEVVEEVRKVFDPFIEKYKNEEND